MPRNKAHTSSPHEGGMSWHELVDGFFLARRRDLSPATQAAYGWAFRLFGAYWGDAPAAAVTPDAVRRFLDEQAQRGLAARSVSDLWVALSSLWTWAAHELHLAHPIRGHIPRPKHTKTAILPFAEDEIKALARAAEWAAPWVGRHGKPTRSKRPSAKRDRAIILALVDTGLRASELCALTLSDYDSEQGRLHVRHGKGDKARAVYLGDRARLALWAYLATRKPQPADPLFVARTGAALDRNNLRHLLAGIGRNARVADVHPHRFRHTYAVTFLRNGGNVFELQRILGHEGLDTVRTYLALAQTDIAAAQRKHSPADGWKL